MKTRANLTIGDLVTIHAGEASGYPGIVTRPISENSPGHVLVQKDGYIQGMTVSIDEVDAAEMNTEGYAQLAYSLIKLGSHVIEKRLLNLI
jgi:hypothetical protein